MIFQGIRFMASDSDGLGFFEWLGNPAPQGFKADYLSHPFFCKIWRPWKPHGIRHQGIREKGTSNDVRPLIGGHYCPTFLPLSWH